MNLDPRGWAFRPLRKSQGTRTRSREARVVHFFERKGRSYRLMLLSDELVSHCGKYKAHREEFPDLAEIPEKVKGNGFKHRTRELVYPACNKCYARALNRHKGNAARAPSPYGPGRTTKGTWDPPSPLPAKGRPTPARSVSPLTIVKGDENAGVLASRLRYSSLTLPAGRPIGLRTGPKSSAKGPSKARKRPAGKGKGRARQRSRRARRA